VITTGAGDHFNAGFCLGQLLGFDLTDSLACGVSTSGFYVQSGQSPSMEDLANLLTHWPS
jgi:sugar/nucleoside kinase (ribokinase family)